jgi:YesN/AraC family two-component response regulator
MEVSDSFMKSMLEYYDFIVMHYHNKQKFRVRIIRGLLYAYVLEVASLYKDGKYKDISSMTRQDEITVKFFFLLMKHHRQERSITFYADKMCLTSKYLSMIVKDVTKQSIQKWISIVLINDIMTVIKTSSLKINQISDVFNFPNPSFFGQFFKKNTGITPYKFKRS